MKKLESTWYNMAIVLTVISIVAGAALAAVNSVTAGPIGEIQKKNEADAIKAVLGGEDVAIKETDTVLVGDKKTQEIVYVTDKGAAVKTVDPNDASFGGGLTIMVGLDEQMHVLGYSILQSNETPGLGAKAKDWFQKGGKGCIIGLEAGSLTVSKDGGTVDAITASTITSRAFLRAINAASQAYAQALGHAVKTDASSGASQQTHNEGKEATNE